MTTQYPPLTAADHVLKNFGPAFVVGPMISGKVSVSSCFNNDGRRAVFTLAELQDKVYAANRLLPGASMEEIYDAFFGKRPTPVAPVKPDSAPAAKPRELYILRGVPGSGKSGVAAALADSATLSTVICSADDYFTGEDGVYRFDSRFLPAAHDACLRKASHAMGTSYWERYDRVIIDNCNIAPEQFYAYEEVAKRQGYRVIHLVVERRHNGRNTHGVSPDQVRERATRLSRTLKL